MIAPIPTLRSPAAGFPVAVAFLVVIAFLSGCQTGPEVQTVRVRGHYVGPQFDGLVAVIHHENIPGIMEAMQMGFKLEEPDELTGIPRGSAIAFDLVMRGDDWQIRRLELLPDTTRLVLPSDSAAGSHHAH